MECQPDEREVEVADELGSTVEAHDVHGDADATSTMTTRSPHRRCRLRISGAKAQAPR
jgi:hypothetical protein